MTLRRWLATALAILSVGEVIGILAFGSSGDPRFAIALDVQTVGFLSCVILFATVGALIIQRRPATRSGSGPTAASWGSCSA